MQNYLQALYQGQDDYMRIISENNFSHLNFDVEASIVMRLISNSFSSRVPLTKTSPQSISHALFNAGALGVSLSPALDHAMLVGELTVTGEAICKLHLTYKGLLHLCSEAGAISHVTTWVIRQADKVRMSNEITSKPQVDIPDLFGERGPVVGSLCTICTPNGDYLTTLMKTVELNQIALLSGNDAWYGAFADEFRKKQVLKRALHTMASAHHGRLQKAAKFLSDSDLDLYERTERKAMMTQPKQFKAKQNAMTRGEALFLRREAPATEAQEAESTPAETVQPPAQTTGLYFK
ncbi:recombination protein RecT [Vibrio crassostreae]|nr:conserved hypothetical protein [Vibrio chagasii]CAK2850971.1 recombination protein RecT [Vibrio crassostreae]